MGWIFGGWPPPPPSAAGGVSFAAVKAALALADSAVGFNGQPLINIGRSTLGNAAARNDATHFGFTRQQRTTTVVQTMTAAGGTASIPGPAAGLVRVLESVVISATNGSATARATTCVLNPGAFPMGTNATQAILFNTSQLTVLGPGETLDLTNNSATAMQLSYSYYDIPDTGITLVRIRFSSTPVAIIPAPAAGFWRRVLILGGTAGTNSYFVNSAAVPYNCDTAAVNWGFLLGATVLSYSTSATSSMSGSPTPAVGLPGLTITAATGDLNIATLAPVATAQNTYVGAYETFPD